MNNLKPGKDYIGVGVGAVIFNNEGKVFLSKRGGKSKNEKGKWEFPGGVVEFGETIKEAIIREIEEEFSIEIEPMHQIDPYDHIIVNENQHWLALCYVCKLSSGAPRICEPEKSEEIGWFSIENAKKLDLALTAQQRIKQVEILNK